MTHGAKVLKEYPQGYVQKVVEKMKAQGANFVMNANVEALEKKDEGYVLKLSGKNGAEECIETDYKTGNLSGGNWIWNRHLTFRHI